MLTDDCWLNVMSGLESPPVVIDIGDRTAMGRRCVISAVVNVTIESSVLVGPSVFITDHSHSFEDADGPTGTGFFNMNRYSWPEDPAKSSLGRIECAMVVAPRWGSL